jgi:beta-N-acetylhexosaminidase
VPPLRLKLSGVLLFVERASALSLEPLHGSRAVIVGCAGLRLSADEKALFARLQPFGFILFRRNVESKQQVRALTAAMRDSVGWQAPILIDQEGGRVCRLRPPVWPSVPAAAAIGALGGDEQGRMAAFLHGLALAAMLGELGIDVNCAPVADTPVLGAHDVIGDRAFASDPAIVAVLARAQAEGMMAGGVMPVVKHSPGHGRATADSHHALPRVETALDLLDAWDFVPFKALADLPAAMVAHVAYAALDEAPASASAHMIGSIIRQRLGCASFLFSDDIGMQALTGPSDQRARAVLAAGCDAALHCSGDLADATLTLEAAPPLTPASLARWRAAWAQQRMMAASLDKGRADLARVLLAKGEGAEAPLARLDALLAAQGSDKESKAK